MATLRALFVAISLVILSVIYSELLEYEEYLANEGTALENVGEHWSNKNSFKGMSVEDVELKGESGSFESPNFPTAANNVDYVWHIKVQQSNSIRLVFVEFDTEPNNDFVFVYDGGTTGHPLLLVHSGKDRPLGIRSSSNEILVRFITNNKNPSRGFQANYYTIPTCFSSTHLSSGMIKSPNYPFEYDVNLNCDWLITVGRSEMILFEFRDVNTEEDHDVIQIFDGHSDQAPFLQRISGNYQGKVIVFISSSNMALVRFTSDKSMSGTGFSAKFYAGTRPELIERVLKDHSSFLEEADEFSEGSIVMDEVDMDEVDMDEVDNSNAMSTPDQAEGAAVVAYMLEVLKSMNSTDPEE